MKSKLALLLSWQDSERFIPINRVALALHFSLFRAAASVDDGNGAGGTFRRLAVLASRPALSAHSAGGNLGRDSF